MTSIFIGGSLAISELNDALRAKLDDFIERGCTVYIGDANGADRAVQQHLAARGYREVVVYCMDRCRDNVGAWPTKRIGGSGGPRDFAHYAAKDKAMADDAKCGMMLWDGESKGTLNNMQNLLAGGKKVLVYFSPTKDFHKLRSVDDLNILVSRCDPASVAKAQLKISRLAGSPQLVLPTR